LGFFSKKKVEYQLVEIDRHSDKHLGSNSDIASLANHPGMLALMARMRVQKAAVESLLKNSRHQDLSDVAKLQAGIIWLSWIEKQVNLAVGRQHQEAPREPFEQERAEFAKIAEALHLVGRDE
jgi:hypothetical protein